MSVTRYYAQHTELWSGYASRWDTGWQIFDRTVTDPDMPEGGSLPVCFVRNRTLAFKIRDALNKAEKES